MKSAVLELPKHITDLDQEERAATAAVERTKKELEARWIQNYRDLDSSDLRVRRRAQIEKDDLIRQIKLAEIEFEEVRDRQTAKEEATKAALLPIWKKDIAPDLRVAVARAKELAAALVRVQAKLNRGLELRIISPAHVVELQFDPRLLPRERFGGGGFLEDYERMLDTFSS